MERLKGPAVGPPLRAVLALALTIALPGLDKAAPRASAAGITVTTLSDVVSADGLCSLREAMANAQANAATHADCPAGTGADTLSFGMSGTITLASALPEVASGGGPLTIQGAGQAITISGAGAHRLFTLGAGGNLTLDTLTLTDGLAAGHGGAILSAGQLSLQRVSIRNSTAAGRGGAVYSQASFTATESAFTGNRAHLAGPSGGGGAVYQLNGTLTLTSSTLDANTTDFQGGGLLLNGATATISRSTISDNTAEGGHGGGVMQTSSTLTLANSTLSGNQAQGDGGGIRAAIFGSLTVRNSTIAGNGAAVQAGGISSNLPIGSLLLANSLLADNTAPVAKDCQGNTISLDGPNLIETVGGCSYSGAPPFVGEAMLAPLGDNGGPTHIHALMAGSPALGSGQASRCAQPPVGAIDQRGTPRPSGRPCDLGAYEATLAGGKNLRLTTSGGQPALDWSPGNAQVGYQLLQYHTGTGTAVLLEVAAAVTAFVDATAAADVMYCYALAPYDWGGGLGISDLGCVRAMPPAGSGQPPSANALSLGQSTQATLTWNPPTGGADSYLLQTVPLDGSTGDTLVLTGTATSSVQTLPPAGACYQIAAYQSRDYGTSPILCGIPGMSTLGGVASVQLALNQMLWLAGW